MTATSSSVRVDLDVQLKHGVLALSGYAVRIAVERGHLVIEDGVANERRRGRFSKITRDLKRVVVIGHSGTVSLEALRWLHDIDAAFVQIDNDGTVIAAAGPIGLNDARLRRAQALAVGNGVGFEIACDLIRQKLQAQAAMVEPFPSGATAAQDIRAYAEEIDHAHDLHAVRQSEANAGISYWNAWREVPVQFALKDSKRVPLHWRSFSARTSALTHSCRRASNPANAMLNYLYAILEAEARLSILAVGCDPGLGVLHSDTQARDSLACDVMEVVRPEVDSLLLDILTTRNFRKADFFERRDGMCRVMPPITHRLAETAPRWRNAVAPIVEDVAQRFLDTAPYNPSPGGRKAIRKPEDRSASVPRLPTKLTQSRRRAAQDGRKRPKAVPKGTPLPKTCAGCGEPLKWTQKRWCVQCWEPQQYEHMANARTALKEKRAAGMVTGTKMGERQAKHRRVVARWNRENERPDPDIFQRDIYPKLKSLPVITLVRATGLSYGYCNQIKLGHKTPHPRWWEKLRELA